MAVNPKMTRQQANRLQVKCLRAATRGRVILLEPARCVTVEALAYGRMDPAQRRKAKRRVRFEKRVRSLMEARASKSAPLFATGGSTFHQTCCYEFSL